MWRLFCSCARVSFSVVFCAGCCAVSRCASSGGFAPVLLLLLLLSVSACASSPSSSYLRLGDLFGAWRSRASQVLGGTATSSPSS